MLYCVSCLYGLVGVFSSLDKISEIVSNKFKSIVFIIQVFKNNNNPQLIDNKHIIWIIACRNFEYFLYASDNKDEIENITNMFNKIKKPYEDPIEYMEQEIDVLSERVNIILTSIESSNKDDKITENINNNVIFYA